MAGRVIVVTESGLRPVRLAVPGRYRRYLRRAAKPYIYEVLRSDGLWPRFLEDHLDRLVRSAALTAMVLPVDRGQIGKTIEVALKAAAWEQASIQVVVVRGSGSERALLRILVGPFEPLADELYRDGARVVFVAVGDRPGHPSEKSGERHAVHERARRQALACGANEALLVDSAGRVPEGATSNVFIVCHGRVLTPPLADGALSGVTRRHVIEAVRAEGIELCEQTLCPDDLRVADELWITSTSRGVLPVTWLDGCAIGDGRPGPITLRASSAFAARVGCQRKGLGSSRGHGIRGV